MEKVEQKKPEILLSFSLVLIAGVLVIVGAVAMLAMILWTHNMFQTGLAQPYTMTMAVTEVIAGAFVLAAAFEHKKFNPPS